MASANSNIQISDLDFNSIKTNLKTYLKSQTVFQDYNFEGSGLSTLLNILSYNTHYNAYYLNMVANEMFLDTAVLRSSVISHAKLLNYTPKSAAAPAAYINVVSNQVSSASLTLPKFTRFQSEAIDGVNYTFITKDSTTVNAVANTATFLNVEIVQGEPINWTFPYDVSANPKQLFVLPDTSIDTSTLLIQVQKSSIDTSVETYTLCQNVTNINGGSFVYFLQEGLSNNYEIYFGDGILGKSLDNGNIVLISYITTNGNAAASAANFVLLDNLATGNNSISTTEIASKGASKESIDSIKFNAPKSYSAQGRAVTKDDYIAILQNNSLGYKFDSINVWGGAENVPPVYGQVFISIKPSGGYALTQTQKDKLINFVIRPVSVITVKPAILDPDYTYLVITANVLYDQKRTTLSSNQLQTIIKSAIQNFANSTLNTFDSTFSIADLITTVKNSDSSIITNDCKIQVQKKFYPTLDVNKSYALNYGTSLTRGVITSGINSSPTIQYYNSTTAVELLTDVFIEEVPFSASGLQSINLLNPGFNYTKTPTVTISGDGIGATATAQVINGYINKITLTNIGSNYTQALVSIVNAEGDTTGSSGSAYATLQGQYGTLRTYYYDNNNNNKKTILDDNIGTVDYYNGTINLKNFQPHDINDPLGQLSITATPESTIISSSQNRIITVDPFDATSIVVNITAK